MKTLIRSKFGLVLTEALVAMTIMTTGVIILSSILNNAVNTLAISRDYMIGQNLVTEGVEVVKIVRDTNWLLSPSNTSCWLEATPGAAGCTEVEQKAANATAGNYITTKDANSGVWKLSATNVNPLDLSKISTEALAQAKYVVPIDEIDSKFYRSITFILKSATQATFEVKVQWLDGKKVRTITRKTTLYNYL